MPIIDYSHCNLSFLTPTLQALFKRAAKTKSEENKIKIYKIKL